MLEALYANPQILILDEATSHIDTETEELIQKAMAVVEEGEQLLSLLIVYQPFKRRIKSWLFLKERLVERGATRHIGKTKWNLCSNEPSPATNV